MGSQAGMEYCAHLEQVLMKLSNASPQGRWNNNAMVVQQEVSCKSEAVLDWPIWKNMVV